MHVETQRVETLAHDDDRAAERVERTEWVTPEYSEQSTCAEICAYVFTA
jgi:hypothetical protein